MRQRHRNLILLLSSLFFYVWSENWFVLILLGSILIDYTCGLVIAGAIGRRWNEPIETLEKKGTRTWSQKVALYLSILTNLSILGIFKYFNFGIENYNALMDLLGFSDLLWKSVGRVALPLGISFYTFQSMSYTFDVYLGRTRATRSLLRFTTYVMMFPQLVAGPIIRYRDVARQLTERVVTQQGFAYGVRRFIIGLGKKVLIADTLAGPVDQIFRIPLGEITPGLAWLGLFSFMLQLYYDFSGYSDMAIGLGRMLGFRFKENFRYPFVSRSGTEFFQRWHISLNTWLRDYPYRALGGNRGGAIRTAMNTIFILVLCGLWHGASWTFVAWGLLNGVEIAMERLWQRTRRKSPFPAPVAHLLAKLGFLVGMAFFRSESFTQSIVFIKAMFGFATGEGIMFHVGLYLDPKVVLCLLCGSVGSLPFVPWLVGTYQRMVDRCDPATALWLHAAYAAGRLFAYTLILLAASTVLSSGSYNPFIYYRF